MITITGGKLTTWRRMAKMTVDRLVERDARDAPCRTHEIPLGQAIAAEELPRVEGVPERSPTRRSPRATATPPTRCSRSRPSAASSPSRSCPASPTCSPRSRSPPATSRRAAIGDVLLRRTRLGLLAARELTSHRRRRRRGADPVQRVGDVLARELGWDAPRVLRRSSSASPREAAAEGIVAETARALPDGSEHLPPAMP